jgi:hypothetical protein
MLAGLFAHPYIAILPDEAAIAEAVATDTTWWGLVHLTTGVASGLLVLAFLAVRSYLREAGEDRWSILVLPFIVVGGTLFVVLPGMEFAPLAAAEAGGNVQAAEPRSSYREESKIRRRYEGRRKHRHPSVI